MCESWLNELWRGRPVSIGRCEVDPHRTAGTVGMLTPTELEVLPMADRAVAEARWMCRSCLLEFTGV